ncbi:MAG: dockerin type I domain-containing protein [Planctomycetota bacterium]
MYRSCRKQLQFQTLETRLPLASGNALSSPWTNPLDPLDVNGDGKISPRDALVGLNQIAREANQSADSTAPPIVAPNSNHADVNGDSSVTAIDALRIINALAQADLAPSAELASPSTSSSVVDLVFEQDFSRSFWNLDLEQISREFRFIAQRDNAAVDLSSLQDESLAEIRILDELGMEVISDVASPGRSRFEGIKFPTEVGRSYTVTTTLDNDRADAFAFSLDVLQFDLGRWPDVVISDDPALAWSNARGVDADFGNDIHSDNPGSATPLRPFETTVFLESNIDDSTDVDWFHVSSTTNAISVSVRGTAGQLVRFDAFDTSLSRVEPVQTVLEDGRVVIATYLTPRPGETLLRVRGIDGSHGPYQIHIQDIGHTTDAGFSTDPFDIPDLVGNSIENAADIAVEGQGFALDHRLEFENDVDVFRIPNALPGSLIAIGVQNIRVELLDPSGSLIDRSDPVFNLDGIIDTATYQQQAFAGIDSDYVFVQVSSSVGAVGRYQLFFALTGSIPATFVGDQSVDPFKASARADSAFGNDVHGESSESASSLRHSESRHLISHLDHSTDVDSFYLSGRNGWINFSMSVRSEDAMGLRLQAFDFLGNELTPNLVHDEDDVFGISFGQMSVPEYTDASGAARTRVFVNVSSESGSTGRYALVASSGGLNRIAGIDDHVASVTHATNIGEVISRETLYGYLDQRDDRDAFRFTAEVSEMSILLRRFADSLALGGQGTFNVYDLEGRRIEPKEVIEEPTAGWLHDRIEKYYDLIAGMEYVAIALNESGSATGEYRLQFHPTGDLLGRIDLRNAQAITIPAGDDKEVSLSGRIEQPGHWSYHRISTSSYFLTLLPDFDPADASSVQLDLALYRVKDGSLLDAGPTSTYLFAALEDSFFDGVGEYIVGVRLPLNSNASAVDYDISAAFRMRLI